MMRKLASVLVAIAALLFAQPSEAALAIVQHASTSSTSSNGSVTLGSNPTTGNLLLAWMSAQNDPSTSINTSKWTLLTNCGVGIGSGAPIVVVYRYAQAGDVAALPGITTGSSVNNASEAIEISGVNGTVTNDVEQFPNFCGNGSTTLTTSTYATQTNNDLVLTGVFNWDANATNITGASGWTFLEQNNNFSNYGAWALTDKVVSPVGSISTSYTIPTGAHPSGYITVVLSANGTGSALIASSKMLERPILQTGSPASVAVSKSQELVLLQSGTPNQESVSKMYTKVILQVNGTPKGGFFFHDFP